MDIRTSTAWYPASVNMENMYYWITPRDQFGNEVGQCRLPVSKPVLKVPMVSALEAPM